MSKTHYISKGYNTLRRTSFIKGAAKAIDYYKNVFGATVVCAHGRSRRQGRPRRLQIGDSRIMLAAKT